MPFGYTTVYPESKPPRSFLFSVVATVGPGGASRSLAVAYRQGNDVFSLRVSWPRVHHFVADTLALIEILSDPANRAPLEAEKALAEDWYRRSQGRNEVHVNERPSIPDTPQPPFVRWNKWREPGQQQPQLPWRDEALAEFPFTTTCVLLALLRDDGDADAANCNRTRPGDVQFQPLSTIFRGDCTEYGLVVLDISDLDNVKYGILAFPMHYMAEVWYHDERTGWDPVEDEKPVKEPDVVLVSPRPRVPLSIAQWMGKYYKWQGRDAHPILLRLEGRPLVDATALNYIWPPELENQARSSSKSVISRISNHFRPSKSTTRADNTRPRIPSRLTTSHELLRNTHTDRAIDNLLLRTQNANVHLDEKTTANLQKHAEFRVQLRQRLEEVPDSLGPSPEVSALILRIAYAGSTHLNWAIFRNLTPSIIVAAITSSELQAATALSICVEELDGDLGDLSLVLAQSTTLKQLCFLQRPDRNSDNASARFCTQLLLRGCYLGDSGWLRNKTIYPTCAFSTSLRSRELLTLSSTITAAQVFPVIHMFTFVGHQHEDVSDVDAHHHLQQYKNSYSNSYSDYCIMDNTLLDAERFAVRFLAYLRSVGSGSDSEKAILRFAYKGAFSSFTTTPTVDDDDKSPPPPGQSAVSPIPAGFFDYRLAPNDPSRVRVGDIPPGSWVVLVDRRGRSCSSSDDDDVFLQYSFVKICQTSAEIAPEQQQQQQQQQQKPVPVRNLVKVVGGLTNFLRETAPGSDVSPWEQQVGEVDRDLRTRRAFIETGKRCIGVCVMAESSAHTLLNQLL